MIKSSQPYFEAVQFSSSVLEPRPEMGMRVLVFSLGQSIAGGISFHFVRKENNLVPRGRDPFLQQRELLVRYPIRCTKVSAALGSRLARETKHYGRAQLFLCKFAFV